MWRCTSASGIGGWGATLQRRAARGADEDSEDADKVDGWGKLIRMPCTPIVQSKYEDASSKSVSKEML